jgi:hypothetical protein
MDIGMFDEEQIFEEEKEVEAKIGANILHITMLREHRVHEKSYFSVNWKKYIEMMAMKRMTKIKLFPKVDTILFRNAYFPFSTSTHMLRELDSFGLIGKDQADPNDAAPVSKFIIPLTTLNKVNFKNLHFCQLSWTQKQLWRVMAAFCHI